MIRPPPVVVDDADEAPIRHDINSEDVRRTYPDLPRRTTERTLFVSMCDYQAYRTIRHLFPDFRPPFEHPFSQSLHQRGTEAYEIRSSEDPVVNKLRRNGTNARCTPVCAKFIRVPGR